MRRRRIAAAAALALVALPPVARDAPAQRPAADSLRRDTLAARLPVVEIIGSILPSAGPAVGSGVPARAAIVDGADVDAWAPRLLTGALAAAPGVSLYDDLGSPFKPTLVARGFTASPVVGLPQGVSVFVDGVPVNEPDAGQVNFDLLPLEHVARVEVLSGTASLLGPHSLGGAVNLVTRRPDAATSGAIELAAGSHGRASVEGSAGGARGAWHWYVGGGHERERGWRQTTSARVTNGIVNVGRGGERAGATLQLFGARSYARTAGSLPLSVYAVRPDSNLSAGDFEDLRQLHVAAAGWTRLGGGRGSLVVHHRRHDAERFNVNQAADPDVRGFSANRTLGASADWRATTALGAGALSLRLGAGGAASRVAIRLFGERIDPGLTTDVGSPIRKLFGYALADYRVSRVTLSGGVRWDAVRVPFRNRLDPSRDTTSDFRRTSPRVGARVALGGGASAYASAGRSFRAPAVIELACADPEEPCPLPFALGDDPPLAPVVATTYEVGAAWARGPLAASASAYRTRVRDDIFLFPYRDAAEPEGSTIDGFFGNVARTRREGVELDVQLALRDGHRLYATWAATRATFESEAEIFSVREAAGAENQVAAGDRFPLVPDRTATLGAELLLPSSITAAVAARYTGHRWLRGDEANETAPLDGHWVADLRLGATRGAWTVQAIVRNVLDDEYAAFGTFNVNQGGGGILERFLTPAEPRSVQLVLRRAFGARE